MSATGTHLLKRRKVFLRLRARTRNDCRILLHRLQLHLQLGKLLLHSIQLNAQLLSLLCRARRFLCSVSELFVHTVIPSLELLLQRNLHTLHQRVVANVTQQALIFSVHESGTADISATRSCTGSAAPAIIRRCHASYCGQVPPSETMEVNSTSFGAGWRGRPLRQSLWSSRQRFVKRKPSRKDLVSAAVHQRVKLWTQVIATVRWRVVYGISVL